MAETDGSVVLVELQDARRGALTRADLVAAGLGAREIRREVRTGRLVRVHRDAYRVPAPTDDVDADFRTAVAAVRRRQRGRVLTGPAALVALDLPLFGHPRTVHVAVDGRGGSSARSVTGTVARPPGDQLVVVPGVGTTAGAARAVLDTARLESLVAGVVAADAALARGMTTVEELRRVASTMAGLRGVARARTCASLANPLSETPGESWSAVVLHRFRIPPPRRQVVVVDDEGVIGRVDFWWDGPNGPVVGEFDGRVKYGRTNPSGRPPEDVLWDEKRREDRLRATGAEVVRWTSHDLAGPAAWIRRLRRALGE